MPPAFGRIESELLAEPERGLIEIGDGVHDVVEPEHAATLVVSGPTFRASKSSSDIDPVLVGIEPADDSSCDQGRVRLTSADELQIVRTELGERRHPVPSPYLVEDVLEVLPDG